MNQFNIEFKDNESKYITLYKYIKELIIIGKLKPNEKVPSRRTLSSHLGLSTNTILNAYNLLLDEGYIYSIDKSGYFVSPYKNYKKVEIKEIKEETIKKYKYNFTSNNVDKECFPYYTFRKVAQNVILDNPSIWLTKSPYQGDIDLRNSIASYLYENKGMNVTMNNIIIVSSLEESLDIISTLISIKSFGIENPSYIKVYDYFKNKNKSITLFDIDDEGIVLDKKEKLDLIYVTPYNQFPLGIKMSNQRKKELLSYDTKYILEDDFDCDLISQNKVMSTLFAMNNEKVIYHGSFSHTLCPGMRISYLVIPNSLINIYKNKYQNSASKISSLDQSIISYFLKEGYYYRHLSSLKKSMNEKKKVVREFLSSISSITYVETELSFIITHNKDIEALKKHLEDASINIKFVSSYSYSSKDSRIILSYNAISLELLNEALLALKEVLI